MRILSLSFLLVLIMPAEAPAQMTPEMRDFIVAEHNRLRRDAIGPGAPDEVSSVTAIAMLEVEYDSRLECVAQNYLDNLAGSYYTPNLGRDQDYAHCGGSGSVGENWFSGAPDDSSTGGAVRAWADFAWPVAWGGDDCSERQRYHGDDGCSGGDGHYTQVMWSSTFKVGCGYTATAGTVCNYSPAGNIGGEPPFVEGEACSACPGTHPYCVNGLCSRVEIVDLLFFSRFEQSP